jgi:hypothetical protein
VSILSTEVSRQYYQEGRWSFSKERGIVEGKHGALEGILEKLGQKEVVQKLDYQAFHGEPAEPVDLAPITQPDWNMEQSLLADYQHEYMLKLLAAESKPRIRMIDRITGRAQEINAFVDYGQGLTEGRLEETKAFLQTIGCGVQMDALQQEADRMLQRDPKRMGEQVDEELAKKAEATRAKLREAGQELEEGVREFDAIIAEESPKHPQQ